MKGMIFWKQKYSKMQKVNPAIMKNMIQCFEKVHGEIVLTFNQLQGCSIYLSTILKYDNGHLSC